MEVHELHPLQQEAVDASCNIDNKVVAVTGAAGTGKTTILKMVYDKLTEHGYRVVLCCPTGKAAKRIFELTGIPASTVHRLLEYTHPGDPDPKTGQPIGVSMPRRNRQNPLEFDVVLCDEYAMVNHELHRGIFDALPRGGVVRCFGDDNQLAPIEEDKNLQDKPSPFQEILSKPDHFKVIVLDQVFRQGADSGILFNCQQILKGRYPTKNDQWSMDMTELAVDRVRRYFQEMEEIDGYSFNQMDNQLIVPQRVKSALGSIKLNLMLQQVFHDFNEPHMLLDRKPWEVGEGDIKGGFIRVFIGDKVIINSNLYDLGVFNGETGIIIDLEHETGEVTIDFGDREQVIPPVLLVQNRHGGTSQIDPRKDIDLAYAITTHKSQGSEYRRGIYILNKSNSYMLNRRNFYTAVSRFKEHVHLITDQKGLALSLQKRG
jgi:exodeoxyribonuclease V alpha subunit